MASISKLNKHIEKYEYYHKMWLKTGQRAYHSLFMDEQREIEIITRNS